jgi:hypothetical protein
MMKDHLHGRHEAAFLPLYQLLRRHPAADPIGLVVFVRGGRCDSSIASDVPHLPELGGGIMGIGADFFTLIHTEHERRTAQFRTAPGVRFPGE